MRLAYQEQSRLDCPPVNAVPLNLNCRDEIIPILRALQHVYGQVPLRRELLDFVGNDVNAGSSPDHGRTGLSYWTITVLAAVRLGCNLDYDKLQDLAEQHRTLRLMMGIGDWQDEVTLIGGGFATTSVCCSRQPWRRSITFWWLQGTNWCRGDRDGAWRYVCGRDEHSSSHGVESDQGWLGQGGDTGGGIGGGARSARLASA